MKDCKIMLGGHIGCAANADIVDKGCKPIMFTWKIMDHFQIRPIIQGFNHLAHNIQQIIRADLITKGSETTKRSKPTKRSKISKGSRIT